MTPYLILDNEMITTLTRVAKSGIEVIIIMPHIPDKWYAFAVAKTYYKELIEGGVQIYEYTPGFSMPRCLYPMTTRPPLARSIWITGAYICILNAGHLSIIIPKWIRSSGIPADAGPMP